jgi:hypothetical protein
MSYTAEIYSTPGTEPKVFSIDREHLSFHDTQMEVKDIVAFCYGSTPYYGSLSTEWAGTQVTGGRFYRFVDTSNDVIDFGIMYWPGNNDYTNSIAAQIEYWIWEYFGIRLINDMIRNIHAGYNIQIGELVVNRNGIQFTDRRYSQRTYDYALDWEDVVGWPENEWLLIRSKRDAGISFPVDLRSTLNALVLQRILQYIETNLELRDILRGTKPPLA